MAYGRDNILTHTAAFTAGLLAAVGLKHLCNILYGVMSEHGKREGDGEEIFSKPHDSINGHDSLTTEEQLQSLFRENIRNLQPYRCARDDYKEGILLDANENSYGSYLDTYREVEMERYPDPYHLELKDAIARYREVEDSNVFLGVGSDEAIDLIIRVFCKPGEDEILITPPTYGMYKVCAAINDVDVRKVNLTKEFHVDVDKVLETVSDKTKVIFLCSPGNPTGNVVPHEVIHRIFQSDDYHGMVVVDEAYIDFASQKSACQFIPLYPRLLIMQTMSKAFGLAGIRLGMAFGHPTVIQCMNNTKAPYNINKLTAMAALEAFKQVDALSTKVALIMSEKNRLTKELSMIPIVEHIYPSDTNFLLVKMKGYGADIYRDMCEKGIITRFRGKEVHCEECLRITVGTNDENSKFLTLLRTMSDTYFPLLRK